MKKLILLPLIVLAFALNVHAQNTPHVLFIGIDGWAAKGIRDADPADIPNFTYLMQHGSWTLEKRSVMPSASSINWTSMVCGLPTEMHGFDKWNSVRGTIPPVVDNGQGIPPTIFTILREQRPDAVSGCLYDWDIIGSITDSLSMDFHRYVHSFTDKEVLVPMEEYTAIATDYIKENKPDLFFLYYGIQDEAGHVKGWYGEEYMACQKWLDKCIGQIIEALKEAGLWEDTVIVMTADHGGINRGHGGFTIEEMESPFIVFGKGIRENHHIDEPVIQYDTAATIAYLLGLEIPSYWRGKPITQVLCKCK